MELFTKYFRPGDIYTHVYSGLRGELGPDGHVNPGLVEGRRRGVVFDVGHGAGSFFWRVAVPMVKHCQPVMRPICSGCRGSGSCPSP